MRIQIETSSLVVFESALFRTTTTLIISNNYLILVDPNWLPIEIDFIRYYVDNIKCDKALYLLFTHSDYDHIIGYNAFSDFTTIASYNFTINENKENVIDQILQFDDSNYINRDYKIEYPKIDIAIKDDGHMLEMEHGAILCYQAVGHNPDGLICYVKECGILVLGDYLCNVEFPYIYTSIKSYKDCLSKIEMIINSHKVNYMISGHGDYCDTVHEMHKRIKDARQYISDLEHSVLNDEEFDFDSFVKRYDFPQIMKTFHEGNILLAKKELLKN